MSKAGGDAGAEDVASKHQDDKEVLIVPEKIDGGTRDPNLGEQTVPGAGKGVGTEEGGGSGPGTGIEEGSGAEEGAGGRRGPPDKQTSEELEEHPQESPNLAEKVLMKPPINLLEIIRRRNTKGLEQDLTLLGPGTMIHVRWPDVFKKENKSPWDTDWGYICLTEEAQVSKPPEKTAWNWSHPTKPDITGHIKLEPNRAWEIIRGVATKEQEISRSDRNKDPAHTYNKLKAPAMTKTPLNAKQQQPEEIEVGAEEFQEHAEQFPNLKQRRTS